jgi:hypothetical protein
VPRDSVTDVLVRESDVVLALDTFGGKGAGVVGLGSEWLGVMTVDKPFRPLGMFKSVPIGTGVWVFKRGRRKYVIEPAATAPDVEDRAEDDGDDDVGKSKSGGFVEQGGCASGGAKEGKFDF